MDIKDGLKQDVIIADATGTARLTIWQLDINKLEKGKSYELKGINVREYCNIKYLTPPLFSIQ